MQPPGAGHRLLLCSALPRNSPFAGARFNWSGQIWGRGGWGGGRKGGKWGRGVAGACGSLVVWWLGFRAPSLPRPGCGCDSRSGKRGFFCHLSSLPQIFLNTGSLVCQEVHMHRTLGDQLSSCGSLSLDGLGIGDITPALVT